MPRNKRKKSDAEKEEEKAYTKRVHRKGTRKVALHGAAPPKMNEAGAKSLAKYITSNGHENTKSQNILEVTPACNGPKHRWVVHVKFTEGPYVSSVTVA